MSNLLAYLHENKLIEFNLFDLKEVFDPIDLSDELQSLDVLGLIEIDWNSGLVVFEPDAFKSYENRNRIRKQVFDTPEYMKSKQIKINKPLIENDKGELEDGV